MSRVLRGSVIGLGAMGQKHLRVCAQLRDVELVGLAALDGPQRKDLVFNKPVPIFADYEQMIDETKPDFAIVVVPTDFHAEVAIGAMRKGVHVLVEKPIAKTLEEAEEMIRVSEETGCKLMIGHIERFNSALDVVKKRLDSGDLGQLFYAHATRLSPYPVRIQDVGAILDLAIHDIDLLHYLTGSSVSSLHGELHSKVQKGREDLVSALMRYDNGVVGVLQVGWLSPRRIRSVAVIGEGGLIVADTMNSEVTWTQNGHGFDAWAPGTLYSGALEGDTIKLDVQPVNALMAEQEAFVKAIVEDQVPIITGEDGLAALKVASDLLESCGKLAAR
ncbi:MAG: Gfo/Idh/MocA family oxidoreductase [Fimbriimonadaceae bacterium]